ncbi:MAG: hypothetical protein IKD37_06295 [Clostridia bacterium]|nr:hypothetical protein [Clostridia bacterium]
MLNWWNELLLAQQIFALIAIPSTLILIVQTLLLLFGIGDGEADGDLDAADSVDVGDDGLALFSVRGIMAMLAVTGWSGMALLGTPLPQTISVLIAVLLGFATLVGFAYLMRLVMKLQSSGNIDYGNSIGHIAQVYLPIPPAGTASGKVTLTLQEKYIEAAAITTAEEPLKTGTYVRVVSVSDSGVLLVEPLNQNN